MEWAWSALWIARSVQLLAATAFGAPEPHVYPANPALSAGEHVELRVAPPSFRVIGWRVESGGGFVTREGVYYAPLVVAGAGAAQVGASGYLDGQRASAQVDVRLRQGSVPGAESCLGLLQEHFPEFDEYVRCDDLPELLERAEPNYPASARARGLEDTIPVHALVCATGRVIFAYVPASYLSPGPGAVPIERDPKLVEAAIEAALRYVFQPCHAAGNAYATWVSFAVPFRL
jgi:hypothetical protein